MKRNRYMLFLICIVLPNVFFAAQNDGGQSSPLVLEIAESQSPPGIVYERPISISIKNVSRSEILVNARMLVNRRDAPYEIIFIVTNADGKDISFAAAVNASVKSHKWRVLKPGRSISTVYDISYGYDLSTSPSHTIQAIYESETDPPQPIAGRTPWKGRLLSNLLKID